MECTVCGSAIKEGRAQCGYCGFFPGFTFDDAGLAAEQRDADDHREAIVSKLKNFSVSVYDNSNENSSRSGQGTPRLLFGDGKECDNDVVWSREIFTQYRDEKTERLTINYESAGKKKSGAISIDIPPTVNYWRIGLKINSNLKLRVYLGTTVKGATMKDFPLSLR